MAGLIENGVYTEDNLWFSDNLNHVVDRFVFGTPWLYRDGFTVHPLPGQHYFLITHGITSKADIWLNGQQLVGKHFQQGAYGGHKYDITQFLHPGANAILVQAYETNYLLDSAMGFVDWNPYPPDNGTGVWREIEISQTGPVSLAPVRFLHDWRPGKDPVTITVKVNATNHESHPINATISGELTLGDECLPLTATLTLSPGEEKVVSMMGELHDPQIWWPSLWGDQPLYNRTVHGAVDNVISDVAAPRRVGIRRLDSALNAFGDRTFSINRERFLSLGGGYGPEIFMRWDTEYVRKKFAFMLDMGLNTVRLEGKQEHPELFELADEMGLMIMLGWECCDWWEGWTVSPANQLKLLGI